MIKLPPKAWTKANLLFSLAILSANLDFGFLLIEANIKRLLPFPDTVISEGMFKPHTFIFNDWF